MARPSAVLVSTLLLPCYAFTSLCWPQRGCEKEVWMRLLSPVCEGGREQEAAGWGGGRVGGGIDFWWIEGVLFLLYMRQKTPWHIDLRGEHSLLNVQCKKTRQWKSLTGDSLDDIWYPCVPNVNNCFHLSAISPQDFFLIFCYKPQSLHMYNFVLSNIFE